MKTLEDSSVKTVFLQNLVGAAAPMLFGGIASRMAVPMVFILNDADDAGYFYHDLTQMLGSDNVLFFPSSYRRAVKYGQRDAASEILRTEVLTRVNEHQRGKGQQLYIVTHPEAVAELVVSKKKLDDRTLTLRKDETVDVSGVVKTLREYSSALPCAALSL